jgi:hypothetical protein
MLTIKILNESFLEAIKGKWIKSISGVDYLKYVGLVDAPYRAEKNYQKKESANHLYQNYCFYEIYSNFEAYKAEYESFDYSKYINHETVEDSGLIQELDDKLNRTEEWSKTDKIQFIADNLTLLLENRNLINNNRRYYSSYMPATGFFSKYSGFTYIPIGLLLKAWRNGKLNYVCSKCGNVSYSLFITANGGYPYSKEISLCPSCKSYELIKENKNEEWSDFRSIVNKNYMNKKTIHAYRFDTVINELKTISEGAMLKI